MSIKLQIAVGALVIIMLSTIVVMVAKKVIDLRYALSWMLLCVIVAAFDCFPGLMERLAEVTGVKLASNMVFIVAVFLLAMKVFFLTVTISRISEEKKKITQEVALLKQEVESNKSLPLE